MTSSRSSVSSEASDVHTTQAMSKRWATLETWGRAMFLLSVFCFIVGVVLTVFGFSNTGIGPRNQLPLQILGPVFLVMTLVMWAVGCVFSRLWNMEWKRQQQAMELRDRVQLHALAMDILNNPVISPGMLQDPRIRRQLMMKLRQQKALDISSSEAYSRRSSRAVSVDSRRKHSSVSAAFQQELERRKSKGTINGDDKPACFELPGIQISRIETLDLSDGLSIASGAGSKGKRYIIIHSDYSSDFSRLSCPSDYSLHSRSSRSRSSRASSQVSSRLWDFSPRESEWDADISIGSRDSQFNVAKQDWGGGPGSDYMLSPTTPRKASVVTFDVNPFRRHSSPASATSSTRRKDSGCECTCGRSSSEYPSQSSLKIRDSSCNSFRYTDEGRVSMSSLSSRKKSADQSIHSFRIDEYEGEEDSETTPLTTTNESQQSDRERESMCMGMGESRRESMCMGIGERRESTGMGIGERRESMGMGFGERRESMCMGMGDRRESVGMGMMDRRESMCMGMGERRESMGMGERRGSLRPPLKRNNTDDSEVERRVARLFKEIEYSVTDSVDESRINSQEYESSSNVRNVEAREAQTQTMSEDNLLLFDKNSETDTVIIDLANANANIKNVQPQQVRPKSGRHDSTGSCSDNMRESFESACNNLDVNIDYKTSKSKEKRSKLAAISSALANLGRRSLSLEKKPAKSKPIPRRLLAQGLSDEKETVPLKPSPSASEGEREQPSDHVVNIL